MKRMHEFLNPNLYDWQERHTGTGALTQDGSVVTSNDDDLISAAASTVYQFDHFDKATGKVIRIPGRHWNLHWNGCHNYRSPEF